MFTRPNLAEIHTVLAKHNALIVHFSGTPKGAGSDFEQLFPSDLREVIEGNAQTGLCCSTVLPGDNFADLERANATGCIGVILGMKTPHSVLDAHSADCGSYMEDGVREVPEARDLTVSDIENTISGREPGTYNEWVLVNYGVIGILAVHPYNVWAEISIPYPDDMPDYLRAARLILGLYVNRLRKSKTLSLSFLFSAFQMVKWLNVRTQLGCQSRTQAYMLCPRATLVLQSESFL